MKESEMMEVRRKNGDIISIMQSQINDLEIITQKNGNVVTSMHIEIEALKAKIAQHKTNEKNMKKIITEKNWCAVQERNLPG